jgi:hypothetical protein
MSIPLDYYATFTAGKLIKVGNHYRAYDLLHIQSGKSDVIKQEQENNIVAELDTLK